MKTHELIIETTDDENFFRSFASSEDDAINMLEKSFIPVYQEEEPNEYMLIPTIEIERVYVKILAREI
jgi:hypothetical protein